MKNTALRNKRTGIVYPILKPKEHSGGIEGYNYNRPSDKFELVSMPEGEQTWMGNNPEFVEKIEL